MSLEREMEKFGRAPQAQGPWPADKRAAKKMRKAYQKDAVACLVRTELKSWMAQSMLSACDRLLALPDYPKTASKTIRASYLQSRALALLASGSTHLALEAVEQSNAIGAASDDAVFDLSVGIGNTMLKSLALQRMGKEKEARALLETVRKARPYASSIVTSVDVLEAHFDKTLVTYREKLEGRLPIDPEAVRALFLLALLEGRVADADQYADQVDYTAPKMRGGWTLEDAPGLLDKLRNEVRFDTARAYTAYATGNPDKAAAIMAASRGKVTEYIGKDPRDGRKNMRVSKKKLKQWRARQEDAKTLEAMFAAVEATMPQRDTAPSMSEASLRKSFMASEFKPALLPPTVEQLRLIEGEDADKAEAVADGLMRLILGEAVNFDEGSLGSLLPKAEFVEHYPKLASSASKWLFSDGSGWSQAKEGDGDVRTVRYETLVGSRAMMEEMLLLAVANLARKEGRDAFVILSNRTLQRITRTYGYGTSVSDSGFEAQARIQLVDAASPPPEFAANPERILTIAQIERDLGERYQRIMAAKEAAKEAERLAKQRKRARR